LEKVDGGLFLPPQGAGTWRRVAGAVFILELHSLLCLVEEEGSWPQGRLVKSCEGWAPVCSVDSGPA
jgi:hypothetical protein